MEVRNSLVPTQTLQEVLEIYSHIELSEDEVAEAMIWAKRNKEERLKSERLKQIERDNLKRKADLFQFDAIRTFMMGRAKELFKGIFVLDEHNENIFNLLCFYHTSNPLFEELADNMGVKNPSLKKGILLCGLYGGGKTWLMKLFSKSVRQVYFIRPSKEIANAFMSSKEKVIPTQYLEPFTNASNDAAVFNQPISGLCIDDIGAEGVKNSYGNLANVIGDIIEERYIKELTGPLLHGTTNLTADQLKEHYGGRVTSRMREIFNFIELPGQDRRK